MVTRVSSTNHSFCTNGPYGGLLVLKFEVVALIKFDSSLCSLLFMWVLLNPNDHALTVIKKKNILLAFSLFHDSIVGW